MHAIAEMDTFQWTWAVSCASGQTLDGKIRDIVALDETDSAEFGEESELAHAGVSQPKTAREVDVTDPCAVGCEGSDGAVGDV